MARTITSKLEFLLSTEEVDELVDVNSMSLVKESLRADLLDRLKIVIDVYMAENEKDIQELQAMQRRNAFMKYIRRFLSHIWLPGILED